MSNVLPEYATGEGGARRRVDCGVGSEDSGVVVERVARWSGLEVGELDAFPSASLEEVE